MTRPIERKFPTAKDQHDAIVAEHQRFYDETGPDAELMPLIMITSKAHGTTAMMGVFDSPESKAAFFDEARRMIRQNQADFYTFFSEAWVAGYDRLPGSAGQLMPSQREDRREIVTTITVDRGGAVIDTNLEIERDFSTGRVTLKPFESARPENSSIAPFGGNIVSLFEGD